MAAKHPNFGLDKKSFPNSVDVDQIVKAMKAKSKKHFAGNGFGSPVNEVDQDSAAEPESFATPEGLQSSRNRKPTTFKCVADDDGDDDFNNDDDPNNDDGFNTSRIWGVATPLFDAAEEPEEYTDDVIYSKLAQLNRQSYEETAVKSPNKPKAAKAKPKITPYMGKYSSFVKIGWAVVLSVFIYVLIWLTT